MSSFQGLSSSVGLESFVNQGSAPASPDVTPNSINWANAEGDGVGEAITSNQTISGINTVIYLWLETSDNIDGSVHYYSKNDGDWQPTFAYSGEIGATGGSNVVIAVKSGDSLKWKMENTFDTQSVMLVKNFSDSNALIDTIQFTIINLGGGGPE